MAFWCMLFSADACASALGDLEQASSTWRTLCAPRSTPCSPATSWKRSPHRDADVRVRGDRTCRRRIRGATAHGLPRWAVQAPKNLVMDVEDTCCRAQYLIRDRDGKSLQRNKVLLPEL